MNKLLLVIGCYAILGVGTSIRADTVFDFSGPATGPVGSNQYAVTHGSITLTAFGFNADNSSHNLFWKKNGGDENGLGFTSTLDNELTLQNNGTQIANYIQIDVSQVFKTVPSAKILVNSNTDDETYDLWGSHTLGLIGTKILNAGTSDNTFVNIPDWGTYEFVSVAVHPTPAPLIADLHTTSPHADDNVLMGAISIPEVPEPTAGLLVGLGLASAGMLLRRRS
jgi:uncharacterized protein (UPF0333 family)